MIYVYALIDGPDEENSGPGLEDQPLVIVKHRDLGAVVSHHQDRRIEPTSENAWRHEQVVEAFMPTHGVLPARFGTFFHSMEEVEQVLAERYQDILRAVQRLKGLVEIGVRVVWKTPPIRKSHFEDVDLDGLSGRQYLQSRLAAEQERKEFEALAHAIHTPLQLFSVDSRCHVAVDERTLLAAAYLTPAEDIEQLVSRAEQLVSDRPDFSLVCTGPWPAYNFVPDFTVEKIPT